jgi:hypothetical protein
MSGVEVEELKFGFRWGAATITRICSDGRKRWVVFEITTPKDSIQVYVTRTGKLRVFGKDGEER